ncbi:Ig-like domain repeat protein [Methanosphaera sp. BMS]|uniref:Ig-like domain repeat protein n=1 Tax=Methanosphaera sp. BMS TaxID=1789762 RepID=UPI000DC1F087|nr:Ig-like domain repeat protein [Methanosphaera sp. BMS]AWX32211.1 hypothetical protein AW729_03440 [Methanosphaera sp. BMS]
MNKKNVKIFTFISLIFVALLIIGGVSAAVDDSPAATVDDDTITADAVTASSDVQSNNEIITNEAIKEERSVKGAQQQLPANDYSELKTAVNTAKMDDNDANSYVISLSQSGTYEVDAPIKWTSMGNPTLTIEGNGATITGNSNQFFTINSGRTLIINNIIIDGTSADDGGAINNNGTITLTNSIIKNSIATNGGAIYSIGTVNLENVTLQANEATKKGGAIYSTGTVNAKNVTFKDNLVTDGSHGDNDGGAGIYTTGAIYIEDSTFDSNIGQYTDTSSSSNGADGGAIRVKDSISDMIITNTTFTNNKGRHGGALLICDDEGRNQGIKKITGSTFTGNQAIYGGAIEVYNDLIIEDSVFEENSVKGIGSGNRNPLGGAICVNDLVDNGAPGSLSVKNTTFEKNTASTTFEEGTTNYGSGGAIYNSGPGATIENCTFTENEAYDGGAIEDEATSSTIKDSVFEQNTAVETGGAIFTINNGTGTTANINNCTFTENSANNGGAIATIGNTTMNIDECSFDQNTATSNGGAYYSTWDTYNLPRLFKHASITNSNFTDNTANDYPAIYDSNSGPFNGGSSSTVIDNCKFEDNVATSASGSTIYTRYASTSITNSNISDTNNRAIASVWNNGVANMENDIVNGLDVDSMNNGNLEVSVSNYAELVAITDVLNNQYNSADPVYINFTGDAVYTETEPIAYENINCPVTFIGNGKTIDANGMQFVTIGEGKSLTIRNLTIKNAQADNGAAVLNYGSLTVNSDSVFEDNSALYNGGAIYSTGNLTITKTNFTNNEVTTHQGAGQKDYGGGAICSLGKLSVQTSNFVENTAAHNDVEPNGDGGVAGAILVLNTTQEVSITTSNFTKNDGRHGGAITINNNDKENTKKVTINKNNFVENTALYGAAIDTYQQANITNNNFTKNTVTGQGSGDRVPMGAAICANQGDYEYTLTLINNTFKENEAQDNGCGGVMLTMPDSTIVSSNNVYENNKAYDTGVACIQGSATFTNDTFTGNEGTGYTGVFTQAGDELTITGCTFENNEGNGYGDIAYAYEGYEVTITDSTIITENEFGDLMSPANSDDFEGTNVKVNGVTFAYTDFKDPIVFDVADYQELVDLVALIKSEQIAFNVVANLTGTTYTETEPIVLDDTFPAESFTIEGNGKTIDASGMQFLTVGEGQTVTINNLTVANAQADNGAAIINHGDLTINDAVFEDNQALYRGGAILTDGTLTVNRTKFTNNQVTTHQGAGSKDYGGGAICAFGELTVDESVFTANVAAHNDVEPNGDGGVAGAILILNNSEDITITNSNFTQNTGRHGGAITINDNLHRDEGTVTIDSNNFDNNDALYGAAIDTFHSAIITNNNFTNNWIDGQGSGDRVPMGAAICINNGGDPDYTITLENNIFRGNEAKDNGCAGAVFTMPDTTLNSANNVYENNKAYDTGVATIQGIATFTNDTFTGNEGTGYTGVFTQAGDDLTITECTFENNEGNGYGDIVYAYAGYDVTITDSTINGDDTEFVAGSGSVTATGNTVNDVVVAEGLVLTAIDDLTITEVINGENITVVVKATSDDSIVTTGTVDLYVGDTLISSDCAADAAGFNVTVNTNLYGDNEVTIKYYDDSGVYVSSEKTIDLTIDMIPATIDITTPVDVIATDATVIPFTVTSGDEVLNHGTVTVKVVNENGEPLVGTPDQTIDLAIDNPEFTVTLYEGTYYYNLSYADDDYVADNVTIEVIASKLDAYVAADDEEGYFDEDITVTVYITDEDDEAVTQGTLSFVDEDGNDVIDPITITGEQTTATFNYPLAGQYDITIKYEDGKYKAADWDLTITVFSKEAEINTTNAIDVYAGEDITITANVLCDDEPITVGKLVLYKDDEVVDECELTTGTATFNIPAYTEATQETYVLKYEGNGNYEVEDDATVVITVTQLPATINVNPTTINTIATDATSIPFTVTSGDEVLTVGTVRLKAVNILGQAIVGTPDQVIDLSTQEPVFTVTVFEGTYYYNLSYENVKYVTDNVTVTVVASKVQATIVADDVINGYIDEDTPIVIKIEDGEGNAVTQGTITLLKEGMPLNSYEVTGENTTIKLVYRDVATETITLRYEDGKYTASDKDVTINIHKVPTTTSVEDQNVKVDDTVTLTATVLDKDNNPVTTGTIYFKDEDGNIVHTVILNNGEEPVYSYTASDAITQTYTILYRGSSKYVNSTATATVTVTKYDTTLTVNSPTVNVDDTVTITATLVDENNNPVTAGKVQFKDGEGNIVYTANLANGDELVYSYTSSLEGVEDITVSYLGTYKYENDTAVATVTTNKIEVTINTDKDEYSDLFGVDIPITITITDGQGNAITQGTITIYEDDAVVNTTTITGESTTFTFNYPQAGTHNLVIKYDNYKYSAEDKEVVVDAEAREATIITSDVDAFVGDDVVITATVESDGVEVTEGKIRFINSDGDVLAECDLSNGPATYDFGVITEVFDDEISVEYVSDNYYADDETIIVEVIKQMADVVLTTSDVAIATPITVTANVTYEDEPINQGQIIFTDANGNVIDTVNVVDGIATITVQYDDVGTYTINAEFVDSAYEGEENIDITINKIPVTLAISEDQTIAVGDTATITATVTSEDGFVNAGKVIFTKGTTKLAEVNVVDGVASFDYTPTTSGSVDITAKYVPDDIYSIDEDTATCTVTADKVNTTTTLDDVTLTAGKTVTLTARITASDNSIVSAGKVAFKVNGKTLKDANGKVIYAKVVDGVATYEYEVPSDLVGKNVTIEAVYSGSSKYLKSNDKPAEPKTVLSGVADIEITSAATVTKGENATFTVKVTDNGANVNGGKVVLKINGKTLKDTNGKVIYANVVDGIASVEYLIPESMKSKDYTLSAVFTSSNYERCETNQTITVQ